MKQTSLQPRIMPYVLVMKDRFHPAKEQDWLNYKNNDMVNGRRSFTNMK
jgi:hypothetical protein